jgi:hypothetical protein
MAAAVAVSNVAFENEGDGFETAMRMRSKRQPAIARRINLATVVIQEKKGIKVIDVLGRHRTPGL